MNRPSLLYLRAEREGDETTITSGQGADGGKGELI